MAKIILLLCVCTTLSSCCGAREQQGPLSSIGKTKVWYKYSQFQSYITLGEYPLRSRVTKRQCFIKVYNAYDFMLKRSGFATNGTLAAQWEMFETVEEDQRWFDTHCGD